ncbi:MAG: DNA mismatch endonuclease Vsr [Verrucomicrobiales bacterium]|nr:DNA mismatch endonuclease Vsr [Verrucomicrobiales bacterium]MCP5526665.1 DNA mismatch endonuclease Vsr [Verrucomicrobiales bacterium]
MADVFNPTKRSEVMARIRSRGNRDTELALRRVFRALGIKGWRRQREIRSPKSEIRNPQGGGRAFRVRPDFVFPEDRIAVFVDGCFWHGCPEHATKPRNNAAFWEKKLAANQERDRRVDRELRRAGWRVLRVWEHELTRKREALLRTRLRRWFGD